MRFVAGERIPQGEITTITVMGANLQGATVAIGANTGALTPHRFCS